jgi:hypothetical protein
MEGFFEFMFGASGRINRAKYWVSFIRYSLVGLLVAVILFVTAGIAAPLLIIVAVLTLVPWLLWGIAITTERLHDRDRSAWWLIVFYLVPGPAERVGENRMVRRSRRHGAVLHSGADSFRAHDLGLCRDRLPPRHSWFEHLWTRPAVARKAAELGAEFQKQKKPGSHQATGRITNLRNMWRIYRCAVGFDSSAQIISY